MPSHVSCACYSLKGTKFEGKNAIVNREERALEVADKPQVEEYIIGKY